MRAGAPRRRSQATPTGVTVKWLWELDDGARIEIGAHALPRPRHGVRLDPGRLRDGLRLLRHGPGRLRAPPRRRARSSSRCVRAGRSAEAGERLSNVVFMGMGEPFANYDRRWAPSSGSTATSASAPATSRSRRSGIVPGIRRLAAERSRSTSPCRCTPPTTSCATSSSRSTGATRSTSWSRRAADYVDATGRRLSFEWAMIDGVNDRPSDADELADWRPPRRRPREPHPAQPDAGLADHRHPARRVRASPDRSHRPRRQRHRPPQPRHRHRRRLRSAAGQPRGGAGDDGDAHREERS